MTKRAWWHCAPPPGIPDDAEWEWCAWRTRSQRRPPGHEEGLPAVQAPAVQTPAVAPKAAVCTALGCKRPGTQTCKFTLYGKADGRICGRRLCGRHGEVIHGERFCGPHYALLTA